MFRLMSRSSAVIAGMCLAAALGLVALAGIAISGLDTTADEADAINSDEVATATLAARFALAVDRAFVTGRTLALFENTSALSTELFQEQIPRVEELLVDVRRINSGQAGDDARISDLVDGWTGIRALLTNPRLTAPGNADLAEDLRRRYELFNADVLALVDREAADAGKRNEATSSAVEQTRRRLIAGAATAIAVLMGLGVVGNRRLRREIEPVKEQVEFADTLQLTASEEDAHGLLQRRLSRVVRDSAVTVLNRNNSADRLEPVTDVSSDPALAARLEHAEPKACVAIRSARAHDEDISRPGLIECGICAPCPSYSTCTPLTVGGEVIGSVLLSGPRTIQERERQLVHDSVSQAAPVLANLRNLAIAELRAATDSLTGLPNKRAVGDTLKRMFAHASRTATPFAVVLLDLDHFKNLNDQFGHPAGDQALANVGAAMRSTLRDSDFAGRNGGEEFAVILPGTDIAGAFDAAEKLRLAIARVTVPGVDVRLTASLGLAVYPDHAQSPERLERLADAALYVAKRSGRNRVEVAERTADSPEALVGLVSDDHSP